MKTSILLFCLLCAVLEGQVETVWEPVEDGGALHVQVSTVTGMRYQLHKSQDLDAWEESGDSFWGDGEEKDFTLSYSGTDEFFKLSQEKNPLFHSEITGIDYPVHVYLPSEYAGSSREFPVVYATDAQWTFESFSSKIAASGKQVILVGIEQGPNDRRAIDYTIPGAEAYYEFLVQELIPSIEASYRIDSDERTILGTSYGGLLVGVIMFIEDVEEPVFKNYFSFDPAFNYRSFGIFRYMEERHEESPALNGNLFITNALLYPNLKSAVSSFLRLLDDHSFTGLDVIRREYNVDHYGIADPSFDTALILYF